ncbi:N-acyl-L-homoserine lactone synthetase [Desulfocapsa sulfexigens DSM 10523]|uniref:N-acyl-L-homoserine lactone synthetase n=1 Tax=Desulfocapsa sulfexigens (strain DSM 10523 / SB164P1) TaxID=1167006 RepID=M1P7G4_DESSD|nr:acyl-homoserine-lactone synthase [Desulfocapsa sulfexigens]AGF77637.1 N-acyl-L-homoserine lactone synthetase [Desulfocapsa sulfexigens DSM 10523]
MGYFFEEDLRMQTLTTKEEKNAAFRLRYQVFAEELKWVSGNENKKEIDSYDSKCLQVGVFAKNRLIACLRIHFPTDRFMIENEFKEIIGNHKIQKTPQTIEVTRFCIANDLRKSQVSTKYGMFPIVMALEKAFYNWCRSNDKDTVYMVVSNHFFRLLNLLGMPCTAVAPAVTMPDGVVAIAAISTWTAFEKFTATKKPALLAWFQDLEQLNIEQMVI